MAIYIILIVYVLALPLAVRSMRVREEKIQSTVAFFGMAAIFLLLALKATSVGIDIKGYETQYYIAKTTDWNSWNYVYFERGFILIQKIFSKLNISFQVFAASIYALECFAWYKLISKYSSDARISLLFFICYQFLVFSISGLRQTLSMTICIFAFLLLGNGKLRSKFFSLLLIVFAFLIHSGAFAFIAVLVIWYLSEKNISVNILTAIIITIVFAFLRPYIHNFIINNFRKTNFDYSFFTSGNSFFLLAIFIFSILTYYLREKNRIGMSFINVREEKFSDRLMLRFSLYSVIGLFLFSGSTVVRCVLYITSYLPAFFPGILEKYSDRSKTFIKLVFGMALLFIFINYTLLPNQFELTPYKFFWEP